jgi:hypothetical protein
MNNLTFSAICIFSLIAIFIQWGLNNAYQQ